MAMRFEDKVVIVTGGARGIGLATVKRMAQEGAHVVIADLHKDDAERVRTELFASGAKPPLALHCDVSREEDVARTVAEALRHFGRLDVIINNAGVMRCKALHELELADWQSVLNVDLLGAFFFIRQAFFHMQPGSSIVNVSSIHAIETTPGVAPYAAAKAALLSLTRSAALEGKSRGIRVNAILPGAVDTPMLWDNPNVKSGLEQIQRSDVGRPDDVASAIAFLASDDAAFVQGAAILVDGGRLSGL